jgi:cell division transport system permease protein
MWTRIKYFARETVISLRRNLLMTLAGVLTVAVSLSLLGGITMLGNWVGHGTAKWRGGATLQVYMNVEATEDQIEDVRAELDEDGEVTSFRYCDKECAFKEFQRLFGGRPDLVENTDAEALPASFIVTPVEPELTPALKERYAAHIGVDEALDPGDSLQALITATDVVQWIFRIMSIALLAAALFLIVNTIRLATFARRREIEVMKLVGASNWFIRVPFILESLVQGLVGAFIAIGVVFFMKWGFDERINPRGIFDGFFVTTRDAQMVSSMLILIGILIGAVGSFIGLRRFLRT